VRLALLHPRVAARPCDECRRWQYLPDGTVLTRGGRPVPRPAGAPTPCRTCPKVPPGAPPVPESAVELGDQLQRAWEFYRECRAVGDFPADPLVRWLAARFRAAEDHCEKLATNRFQLAVISAVQGA
jgi:hypothetical protein